jgi:TolA-binding protein
MSDFMDKQKDEFDDFVSKWEKAQQDGVFKGAELPNVNPQTSTGSFFGFTQTNPTDSAAATDKEYWNAINMAANDWDPNSNGVINEEADHKSVPSNPVAKDTLGCDQSFDPQSLGKTFTEEDIEKLTELKQELFKLENKLMTSLGFGDDKNQKKIQTQIESIKKEIGKLSDEMGRAYKNPDQPKHLENI